MECDFESYPATYIFTSKNLQLTTDRRINFNVIQKAPISHYKGDIKTSYITRDARLSLVIK